LTTSDAQRNRSRERRVDLYAIDVSFDAIQDTDGEAVLAEFA
jgi:hypothetical protein